MIKKNITFEKATLNKNKKEHLMLVELQGQQVKSVTRKKKTLNISIVIDISGSMGLSLTNNRSNYGSNINFANFTINNTNNNFEIKKQEKVISKLELVKESAIEALKLLSEGDYVSVIAFDNDIDIIHPSSIVSEKEISDIIDKINLLQPRNWTNLHGAWVEGCTQVSKNFNPEYLNRVIMLTDGETNYGELNKDIIISDTLKIYQNNISTSCFGVGSEFNEVLLNSMAEIGGGNFYYIEKKEDISTMFTEEFEGLNNVFAFNTKLSFDLNEQFEIIECINDYKKDGDIFLLPNVSKNKIAILFKIKSKNISKFKSIDIGNIVLSFNDQDGKIQSIKTPVSINTSTDKQWDKLETNNEIKVQEILLSVAKSKSVASEALRHGDLKKAKELLNQSQFSLGASDIIDHRLTAETNAISSTILSTETKDINSLKKDLFYQSYKTRSNK